MGGEQGRQAEEEEAEHGEDPHGQHQLGPGQRAEQDLADLGLLLEFGQGPFPGRRRRGLARPRGLRTATRRAASDGSISRHGLALGGLPAGVRGETVAQLPGVAAADRQLLAGDHEVVPAAGPARSSVTWRMAIR